MKKCFNVLANINGEKDVIRVMANTKKEALTVVRERGYKAYKAIEF